MSQTMMVRRVLMTADAVGGVWTYALELARGLAKHRIGVRLAVMGPAPSAAQRDEASRIPALDLRHAPFKLEWEQTPWSDVDKAGEWLLSLEDEFQPDWIHLNGYAHGSLPFRAPKIVVGHSCVLSWWEAVHGEAAPADWAEYRQRVRQGIQAADLVAAPSRAMLSALVAHYGEFRESCTIPNGRDPARFHPAPKKKFILAAGRLWDRAKNLELLDRIAPSLGWPVYAAGEGGTSRALKSLGPLAPEELKTWFSRASIYALPARYEPFGLSVLEAALSGCALVLGDIPSLRENWEGAALFARPENPSEFHARLIALIESDELRDKLQRAALERGRAFTADRMTERYLECYAAVLRRSQRAIAFKS